MSLPDASAWTLDRSLAYLNHGGFGAAPSVVLAEQPSSTTPSPTTNGSPVPSSRPPPADFPAALRPVRWIGGGSGAGKSTIARRLATDHGLRVYDTDAAMADHGTRISSEDAPYLTAFKAMDMNERWVNRDPVTMLETFHWYRGEGFDLIVEDLLELTGEAGVIAEGFRLLPHLVAPMLAAPGHAVWLLPTPEFRAAAFRDRDPARDFTQRTGDPERAQRNLAERDRLFTGRLAEEVRRLGLPAIEVGTTMTEDELARRVAEMLGLAATVQLWSDCLICGMTSLIRRVSKSGTTSSAPGVTSS
jgi:hypothetical protein